MQEQLSITNCSKQLLLAISHAIKNQLRNLPRLAIPFCRERRPPEELCTMNSYILSFRVHFSQKPHSQEYLL